MEGVAKVSKRPGLNAYFLSQILMARWPLDAAFRADSETDVKNGQETFN